MATEHTAQNVLGVSYVSPIHIIKFLFANGVPVDDISVQFRASDDTENDDIGDKPVVYHVSDSQRSMDWVGELANDSDQQKVFGSLRKAHTCWLVD